MTEATLEKLISRDAAIGGYGSDHRQRKSLPLPSGKRDWSNSKSHDAMPRAVTGATIAVISSVKHSRHLPRYDPGTKSLRQIVRLLSCVFALDLLCYYDLSTLSRKVVALAQRQAKLIP